MLMNQNKLIRKRFKQAPIFIHVIHIKCILFTTLIPESLCMSTESRTHQRRMLGKDGILIWNNLI